ncbi:MAG: hypothetical protein AVDCRST_MAG88-4381, partial [uncultured Thermomicrobiales bacterium]
ATLLALATLAGLLPAAPPAAAQILEPCYTIESKLNGYVLQVGPHTYTDATGAQYTEADPRLDARLVVGPKLAIPTSPGGVYGRGYPNVQSQVWVRHGDYLASKLNGFALDLLGDATAPATPVVVNPVKVLTTAAGYLERTPERFAIDAQGYIAEHATGLVLDIAGNSSAAGAPVVAWPRKGLAWAANQRWELVRVPDAVCYPPALDSGLYGPLTHMAGTGPGGTQGVPVLHTYLPGGTMAANFTWQSEYRLLSTWAQFRGMTSNGGYLLHYETVRNRNLVKRILPPHSYGTVQDEWAINAVFAEIIETMPEELYIRFVNQAGYALEARLSPAIVQEASDR